MYSKSRVKMLVHTGGQNKQTDLYGPCYKDFKLTESANKE